MNSSAPTVWPNDADGDVLRRLAANGFDFQAKHSIDFNVDFDTWPPSQEFVTQLGAHYDKVEVIDPDDDGDGYVLFVIKSKLSYELVMFVQDAVSALAAPYGGKCETWGVLQQ
jgi:hypothetical protein